MSSFLHPDILKEVILYLGTPDMARLYATNCRKVQHVLRLPGVVTKVSFPSECSAKPRAMILDMMKDLRFVSKLTIHGEIRLTELRAIQANPIVDLLLQRATSFLVPTVTTDANASDADLYVETSEKKRHLSMRAIFPGLRRLHARLGPEYSLASVKSFLQSLPSTLETFRCYSPLWYQLGRDLRHILPPSLTKLVLTGASEHQIASLGQVLLPNLTSLVMLPTHIMDLVPIREDMLAVPKVDLEWPPELHTLRLHLNLEGFSTLLRPIITLPLTLESLSLILLARGILEFHENLAESFASIALCSHLTTLEISSELLLAQNGTGYSMNLPRSITQLTICAPDLRTEHFEAISHLHSLQALYFTHPTDNEPFVIFPTGDNNAGTSSDRNIVVPSSLTKLHLRSLDCPPWLTRALPSALNSITASFASLERLIYVRSHCPSAVIESLGAPIPFGRDTAQLFEGRASLPFSSVDQLHSHILSLVGHNAFFSLDMSSIFRSSSSPDSRILTITDLESVQLPAVVPFSLLRPLGQTLSVPAQLDFTGIHVSGLTLEGWSLRQPPTWPTTLTSLHLQNCTLPSRVDVDWLPLSLTSFGCTASATFEEPRSLLLPAELVDKVSRESSKHSAPRLIRLNAPACSFPLSILLQLVAPDAEYVSCIIHVASDIQLKSLVEGWKDCKLAVRTLGLTGVLLPSDTTVLDFHTLRSGSSATLDQLNVAVTVFQLASQVQVRLDMTQLASICLSGTDSTITIARGGVSVAFLPKTLTVLHLDDIPDLHELQQHLPDTLLDLDISLLLDSKLHHCTIRPYWPPNMTSLIVRTGTTVKEPRKPSPFTQSLANVSLQWPMASLPSSLTRLKFFGQPVLTGPLLDAPLWPKMQSFALGCPSVLDTTYVSLMKQMPVLPELSPPLPVLRLSGGLVPEGVTSITWQEIWNHIVSQSIPLQQLSWTVGNLTALPSSVQSLDLLPVSSLVPDSVEFASLTRSFNAALLSAIPSSLTSLAINFTLTPDSDAFIAALSSSSSLKSLHLLVDPSQFKLGTVFPKTLEELHLESRRGHWAMMYVIDDFPPTLQRLNLTNVSIHSSSDPLPPNLVVNTIQHMVPTPTGVLKIAPKKTSAVGRWTPGGVKFSETKKK